MRNKVTQEEEIIEKWDWKRIAIGATVLTTLGVVGGYVVFKKTPLSNLASVDKKGTLGVTSSGNAADNPSSNPPPLPSKDDINKIIDDVKNNISNITAENLTSSQAAIQTVIQDLQQLQNGKKTPIDELCSLVCKK